MAASLASAHNIARRRPSRFHAGWVKTKNNHPTTLSYVAFPTFTTVPLSKKTSYLDTCMAQGLSTAINPMSRCPSYCTTLEYFLLSRCLPGCPKSRAFLQLALRLRQTPGHLMHHCGAPRSCMRHRNIRVLKGIVQAIVGAKCSCQPWSVLHKNAFPWHLPSIQVSWLHPSVAEHLAAGFHAPGNTST